MSTVTTPARATKRVRIGRIVALVHGVGVSLSGVYLSTRSLAVTGMVATLAAIIVRLALGRAVAAPTPSAPVDDAASDLAHSGRSVAQIGVGDATGQGGRRG